MTPTLHSPHLREYHARLLAACDRARALTAGLAPAQLNWKPAPDKWSIAQCLEHTLLGAEAYGDKMAPAIQRARNDGTRFNGDASPRLTLPGRLILRMVEPTGQRTMKSPKSFVPAQSDIDAGIVDRFVEAHGRIAALAVDCDGLDPNKIKYWNPELRIIPMTATDGFAILAAHAERHLAQAERVRNAPNFPA